MKKTTDGKCLFCDNFFSKQSMKKHLDKCEMKTSEYTSKNIEKAERYFCISVQDYYDPNYWLYIDMPSNSTMKALDNFLRSIWLECCGHASSFTVGNQTYSTIPDREFGDRSMNTKLDSVAGIGTLLRYEYDFGSTTTLKLKIISEFYANKRKNKVKLLARNIQPVIACSYCENPASYVCSHCIYDDTGWVCDDCADKHECGEEMLLPVVNSPRVGVCAYEGRCYD
ncbi:MAG: hypothetical protein IT263_07720 [Saprospiraceae bacterium]|nr:hypothetical protein [Saprospiraceae bacterium]